MNLESHKLRMVSFIEKSSLSQEKKNIKINEISRWCNQVNDIGAEDTIEQTAEELLYLQEKEKSILLLQEYYSKQPKDCPDCEWPLFNVSEKDERGKYGRTKLHQYCSDGNLEMIEEELKNQAEIDVLDNSGCTPLELAFLDNNNEIAMKIHNVFKKYGKIK